MTLTPYEIVMLKYPELNQYHLRQPTETPRTKNVDRSVSLYELTPKGEQALEEVEEK